MREESKARLDNEYPRGGVFQCLEKAAYKRKDKGEQGGRSELVGPGYRQEQGC